MQDIIVDNRPTEGDDTAGAQRLNTVLNEIEDCILEDLCEMKQKMLKVEVFVTERNRDNAQEQELEPPAESVVNDRYQQQ